MQALFEWLAEQDKAMGMPDLNTLPVTEMRAWRSRASARTNADLPEVESVTRVSVPGLRGAPPVVCDLIVPKDAEPGCVLFLHGGGWVFGDINSHTRLARMLAVETRKRLLYADYRLAPENPYPAALDDTVAAWRWIVAQAEGDPAFQGTLAICGDSAGGNLALACILHEQELGRRAADIGMLFYGVYDDDIDSPSYLRFATGHGLARPGMAKFWSFYAPSETPGQPRQDPLMCPVRASEAALARLPPLYLNASHLDPLLCDTFKLAERLEAAGCTFEVNIHEGLQHGFMQQTARLAEARRAFALMGDFFRRHEKR
jgi:acetyl esterase